MAKVVKKGRKERKVSKFVYWAPRILSIIFIIFLSLFSLDIFDMKLGFWGTVVGLFMHNIPVLILLVVLLIAWKHEIVGGIAWILAGILYTALSIVRMIMSSPTQWYMLSWVVQIAGPAFFIGILFFINWFQKKK